MENFKKILTHPGIFHADDVFAVAMLWNMGYECPIERRVPTAEELEDNKIIVLDVGGRFDRSLNNYDHHQRNEKPTRWDSDIPYSSFGLVFDHFFKASPFVTEKILQKLVLPIDAIDNGISDKGNIPVYSLSQVVSSFNPVSEETSNIRDAAFYEAVEFAMELLEREISLAIKQEKDRESVLASPVTNHVLVMDKCFAGWQESILKSEDHEEVLFVIYPGLRGGFQIQAIPAELGSFNTRKSLPEEWAGLRDEKLSEAVGIPDAIFCHPGRFVGGAESVESAMRMAELAVSS